MLPAPESGSRYKARGGPPATINKTTTYKTNLEELRSHNAWPERNITAGPPGAEVLAELDYAIAAIAQSTSGCAGPQEVPQHRHLRSDGGVQRRIDVGRKERRVI